MHPIHKHAGEDGVAIHIRSGLIVAVDDGCIIEQKFPVDEGIIGEIAPKDACHLRTHHNAQKDERNYANADDGNIQIGLPCGGFGWTFVAMGGLVWLFFWWWFRGR